MNLKQYYGPRGRYLSEHKKYFSAAQLKIDLRFIISVLKLKKTDKILDLACGHGRHLVALAKKGFDIDGVDFSAHLLSIARKQMLAAGVQVKFFRQDVERLKLPNRYDKIFLFFSEFGLFNAQKFLSRIARHLKPGGLFLLDTDNVFRLINHLKKHPKSRYTFDPTTMELKEKGGGKLKVRYYILPELEQLLIKNGLRITSVYGGYRREPLDINARRQIIVAKKV